MPRAYARLGPSESCRTRRTSNMKIGIDLGGSNLRIGVVGKAGALDKLHKEPVGEPRDPESLVERITAIVLELAHDELAEARKTGLGNPVSVGVGIAAMLRD